VHCGFDNLKNRGLFQKMWQGEIEKRTQYSFDELLTEFSVSFVTVFFKSGKQ